MKNMPKKANILRTNQPRVAIEWAVSHTIRGISVTTDAGIEWVVLDGSNARDDAYLWVPWHIFTDYFIAGPDYPRSIARLKTAARLSVLSVI